MFALKAKPRHVIGAYGCASISAAAAAMTWSVLSSLTTRGADQRRLLRRRSDQEPGVDRDAVAADAGAGPENIDARVTVGEADHLPHVDAHPVCHKRELVGESDVEVTTRSPPAWSSPRRAFVVTQAPRTKRR